MNAIIIEDNKSSRTLLVDLIKQFCPEVTLIGGASTVQSALSLIVTKEPELVFLDVELPDGTAFDLLKQLPSHRFRVIFTTAFEKYAIKAIKYSAIDYLLKPIDPDELSAAVEKAKKEIKEDEEQLKVKHLLKFWNKKGDEFSTILLKDKYGIQLIKIDEILHLEAHGSYTKLYILGQGPIMTTKLLKELELLLPTEDFFRSHLSHLINLNHLFRYDKRDTDLLILKNGDKVPLATRRREQLIKRLLDRNKSDYT